MNYIVITTQAVETKTKTYLFCNKLKFKIPRSHDLLIFLTDYHGISLAHKIEKTPKLLV